MENKWQPIETAPKDGRRIQLKIDDEIYHGWYEENFNCFMGMDEEWNLLELYPSHWQRLNYPPAEGGE